MKKQYIEFVPGVESAEHNTENDIWFIFNDGRLMVRYINEKVKVPITRELEGYTEAIRNVHYLGKFEGRHCYTAEINETAELQKDFKFENLRSILDLIDENMFLVCSRAVQIIAWDKDHRFCGRCGSPMEEKTGERAKQCVSCGFINYPRISPAIIVAVTNGEKLLMAHNKNFRPGFYSVIAGFVDPGETFEQCVKREVMEEVGIKVKNIRYFRSQPWPFPNSLMVAFTAEYDEGEIQPDGIEIEHAGWYAVDNMPPRPSKSTVAGKLIEWFINKEAGCSTNATE